MSAAAVVAGELVVRRPGRRDDGDAVEVVGVDGVDAIPLQSSTALDAPRADRAALAPWSVDRSSSGAIVVAGVELHPAIARDLYQRLGALLDEGDRHELHAEWVRLEAWLDRQFAGGTPVSGRTVGRPSQAVAGVAVREREDQVAVRLATYVVAFVRPARGRWEGAAWQLRPTVTGHERRPVGVRVRLEHVPDGAPPRPRALPGPCPAPAAKAAPQPILPDWLRARRDQALAEQEALLQALRGGPLGLDELAGALPCGRDRLRAHLEVLVERGAVHRADAEGVRRWRCAPAPKPQEPRAASGRPGTRLDSRKAPKGSRKAGSRPSQPARPAPPAAPLRSCWTCNTSAHTAAPCCPVCRTPYR